MAEQEDKIIPITDFIQPPNDPDGKIKKMNEAISKLDEIGKKMIEIQKHKADIDAKILKLRYDAFVRAGFSKTEAMELLKSKTGESK